LELTTSRAFLIHNWKHRTFRQRYCTCTSFSGFDLAGTGPEIESEYIDDGSPGSVW